LRGALLDLYIVYCIAGVALLSTRPLAMPMRLSPPLIPESFVSL
jgi:hypothetical protein